MARRFNYTDRVKIDQQDISLRIITEVQKTYLIIEKLAITRGNNYDFDDNALIFIEAYNDVQLMRFSCGTFGHISIQEKKELTDFISLIRIKFRVKVVSPDDSKKLLGLARKIQPELIENGRVNRIGLLPVEQSSNVHPQVWRVFFDDGIGPVLQVNPQITSLNMFKTKRFFAMNFPLIIQTILTHAFIVHKNEHFDWTDSWKTFCSPDNLPGTNVFPDISPEEETYIPAMLEWIDEVGSIFAGKYSLANMPVKWEE